MSPTQFKYFAAAFVNLNRLTGRQRFLGTLMPQLTASDMLLRHSANIIRLTWCEINPNLDAEANVCPGSRRQE